MNAQDKVCTYVTQTQWFYLQDMIGEEKDLDSTCMLPHDIMEKQLVLFSQLCDDSTQYYTTHVEF